MAPADTDLTARIEALGKNQQGVLRSLGERGSWAAGSGWIWSNRSETVKILDSLVRRGLATVTNQHSNAARYTPTAEVSSHFQTRRDAARRESTEQGRAQQEAAQAARREQEDRAAATADLIAAHPEEFEALLARHRAGLSV